MIIDQLKLTRLFSGLSLLQLEEVARYCTYHILDDGDIVMNEKDWDNFDIFIICKGYLEIVSSASKQISDEVVISTKGKGILGEMAWLTKAPRTATIRSHGPAELIQINGKALEAYLENNTQAGYHFMKQLAIQISENTRETSDVLKQLLWRDNL